MNDDERDRLSHVEREVSTLRVEQTAIKAALAANTDTTLRVERNTEEIVQLVKGGKILSKLLIATAGAAAAAKGLKLW